MERASNWFFPSAMAIRESEGIVLRQYTLSEADRIVVLLTRSSGILRAVAPGAKRMKSRMGAALEPLNHVQLQYSQKEGRDLARVWHCETLYSYLGKNPTLQHVYGYTYFAELTQELVQEQSPNPLVFRLFLASLGAGQAVGVTEALVRYFEFWMLKLSGLLPDYGSCSSCGKCVKEDGFYAWLEAGQVRCLDCAGGRGMRLSPEAAGLLNALAGVSPQTFAGQSISGSAARDLERLSLGLLEINLEKRLKSSNLLMTLLRGN
jgi:DNA repair protein RecO (recombination protein O)